MAKNKNNALNNGANGNGGFFGANGFNQNANFCSNCGFGAGNANFCANCGAANYQQNNPQNGAFIGFNNGYGSNRANGFNRFNQNSANSTNGGFLGNIFSSINNSDFIKGALVGAAISTILANKTTQEAIFGGAAKLSNLVEAAFSELKDRYEDAKAAAENGEI